MFRPAARAVIRRQIAPQVSSTTSRTLFSAAKAPPKKSFKSTLARWALAAGGTYWYMNSNVLAEETKYYKTPPRNIDHWYEDDYTRRMDAQYQEQERLERLTLAKKSAETAAVTQQVATGSPITGAAKVNSSSNPSPATTSSSTDITGPSNVEKTYIREGTTGSSATGSMTSSSKTGSVSDAEDNHLQTASEAGATRRAGSASEVGSKPVPAAKPPLADTTSGHIAQEDAVESHGKTPVETKLTEPTSPEELEAEANQQGAFNPETGEINWDCPCLGGMAHGPCGEEFKSAFSCFIYSEAEPKGVDCIDKFKHMQDCFRKFPEVYGNELEDDEDGQAGGNDDGLGAQIDEEIDAAIDAQNADPGVKPQAPPSTDA